MDFFYSDNDKYEAANAELIWKDGEDGSDMILHYKEQTIKYFLSDDDLIKAGTTIEDDAELTKHILSLVCQNTTINVDEVYNELLKNDPKFNEYR